MPAREKPQKGKAFFGREIVFLDVGKLSAVSGKPKSRWLRPLSRKMQAEIKRNWAERTEKQRREGKRVWTSNPLLRPGEPFTSRKHPGKVFVPIEQAGIGYKQHLEGIDSRRIRIEAPIQRILHPFNLTRSLPFAVGIDAELIVRAPNGKRYLYMARRSDKVEKYKGWVHFAPAKYPVAERKGEKGPYLGLRDQVLKAVKTETGIPQDRISFLGQDLKPLKGKGVTGAVIRTGAKGFAHVSVFPVLEIQATEEEIGKFLQKAKHSWESSGGPILVELTPEKLREFFEKARPIYPQAVKQLVKAVERAQR